MTVEPMLRLIAGVFVVASVLLGMFVHPVLPLVHRVRGRQPLSVRVHELVPDDDHPAEERRS